MKKANCVAIVFIIIILNCKTTTLNQNADIIPEKSHEIGGNINFSLGYSVPTDLFIGFNFGLLYRYGITDIFEYQLVPNFQINASPLTFAFGGLASFMGLLDVSFSMENQFKIQLAKCFSILPGFGSFIAFNYNRGLDVGYSIMIKFIGDRYEDFYFGPFFHLWGDFYNRPIFSTYFSDGFAYFPYINTGFSWGWQKYGISEKSLTYYRHELTLACSFATMGGISIYFGYSIFFGNRYF